MSSPLVDGGGLVVTPLILKNNPSLITIYNGGSVGSSVNYNIENSNFDISFGYTDRFYNSGFSFLYNNYSNNSINEIITAFGTTTLNLNFGADFKFIIKNSDVDFTVDAGVNYLFSKGIYTGIYVGNALNSDFINEINPFEIDIISGGSIPRINKFYYDLKFKLLLLNDFSDLGYGGYLSLKKHFFNNPQLIIYASSDIIYDEKSDISTNIEGAIGTKIKMDRIALNIFCGTKINIENIDKNIYCEFSLDTKHRSSNKKLKCDISISNENSDVIISTKGIFKTEKQSLKRWTLFIYEKDFKTDNIIKTFSGGNIPPSSILWDKRDSSGKLVDSGEYFVKLVLIDTINRSIQSNREVIFLNY